MTDLLKPTAPEVADPSDAPATNRAKRPYEPPQCEKKRSIHRVTLISGVGNMSVGALSVMGG
jgi:hypothetical protein